MSFIEAIKEKLKTAYETTKMVVTNTVIAIQQDYQNNPAKYDNFFNNTGAACYYYMMPEEAQKFSKEILPNLLKETGWLIPSALHSNFTRLLYAEFQAKKFDVEDKEQAVSDFFKNYFLKDNGYNLIQMLKKWKRNKYFSFKRISILHGCIKVINQFDNRTAASVVFPTIISQLEGVWVDILKAKFDCYCDRDKKRLLKEFIESKEDQLPSEFMEISYRLMVEKLFKYGHSDDPDFDYTFSRNKVLHGESTSYGKIKNVLKAFLMLDFLYEQTNMASFDNFFSLICEIHHTQYLSKYRNQNLITTN